MTGMKSNDLGVIVSTEAMDAAALVGFCGQLEQMGYESLWLPELFGREPVGCAGFLLGQTKTLRIATGIANIYVRDAHAMAQTRQTLAELSGGRFILGLGVSNVGLNATRGHDWQLPVPKMRAYLDSMEAAQIDSPTPKLAAPLYIAAHGPKLQALGASRTDGIITYLMPLAEVRRRQNRFDEAANHARRAITILEASTAETWEADSERLLGLLDADGTRKA